MGSSMRDREARGWWWGGGERKEESGRRRVRSAEARRPRRYRGGEAARCECQPSSVVWHQRAQGVQFEVAEEPARDSVCE